MIDFKEPAALCHGMQLQAPALDNWPDGVPPQPRIAGKVVRLVEQFDDGAWGVDVLADPELRFPEAWAELDEHVLAVCTPLACGEGAAH